MVVLTLLDNIETLTLYEYNKFKWWVVGEELLINACGLKRINRVRNEMVQNLCDVEKM